MSEHERTIGSVLEEMKREKERQARASELSNCCWRCWMSLRTIIARKVVERLKEESD